MQFIRKKWQDFNSNLALVDGWILFFVGFAIIIGFVMVYSATMYLAEGSASTPNPGSFLIRQASGVALGVFVSCLAVTIPSQYYTKPYIIYGVNIAVGILLIATLVIGTEVNGAKSWINLGGLNIQPGEFAKISLIFLTGLLIQNWRQEQILSQPADDLSARILTFARNSHGIQRLNQFSKGFVARAKGFVARVGHLILNSKFIILLYVSIIGLIMHQPDLGMAVIIACTTLIMIAVNLFTTRWVASLAVIVTGGYLALRWIAQQFGDSLIKAGNYQLSRIGSFVDPFRYASGAGFQLVNAYIAMSRGGLWGLGIGKSITKQYSLPAGHTDYILAIIGEEMGFFGICLVLLALFMVVILTLRWAANSVSPFRKSVFSGIGSLLLVQILINLGGITGILPLTGVTLPFISYGGTSMMISVSLIGALQAMIIAEKKEQLLQEQQQLEEKEDGF